MDESIVFAGIDIGELNVKVSAYKTNYYKKLKEIPNYVYNYSFPNSITFVNSKAIIGLASFPWTCQTPEGTIFNIKKLFELETKDPKFVEIFGTEEEPLVPFKFTLDDSNHPVF